MLAICHKTEANIVAYKLDRKIELAFPLPFLIYVTYLIFALFRCESERQSIRVTKLQQRHINELTLPMTSDLRTCDSRVRGLDHAEFFFFFFFLTVDIRDLARIREFGYNVPYCVTMRVC